jgi:hypothetical protein
VFGAGAASACSIICQGMDNSQNFHEIIAGCGFTGAAGDHDQHSGNKKQGLHCRILWT